MNSSKEESIAAEMTIDDATPLMAALLGSPQYSAPREPELALAHRKTYDMTLVCGWEPADRESSAIPAETAACEDTDTRLREALGISQIAFAVLYGPLSNRIDTALKIILFKTQRNPQKDAAAAQQPWQSSCEKCSDPACEKRLFTQLLVTRKIIENQSTIPLLNR